MSSLVDQVMEKYPFMLMAKKLRMCKLGMLAVTQPKVFETGDLAPGQHITLVNKTGENCYRRNLHPKQW